MGTVDDFAYGAKYWMIQGDRVNEYHMAMPWQIALVTSTVGHVMISVDDESTYENISSCLGGQFTSAIAKADTRDVITKRFVVSV